jgi:hypothetical protein
MNSGDAHHGTYQYHMDEDPESLPGACVLGLSWFGKFANVSNED